MARRDSPKVKGDLRRQFESWPHQAFRDALLAWGRAHARDLPWRQAPDPYRVLVSEVMLQQTQVATVIPYFARFLQAFPTVQALADAELDKVLRLWEGLGYYRRARSLHQTARTVVNHWQGAFPETVAELQSLPGIGRYTAGAIASLAFDKPAPILEANTFRLWGRLLGVVDNPRDKSVNETLWQIAESILPAKNPGRINELLMDVGAEVCTPKAPACSNCPLRQFCKAFTLGDPERFPGRAPEPKSVDVDHIAVVLWSGDLVLVQQRPATGRWAGLWEFVRVDREPNEVWEAGCDRAIRQATSRRYRLLGERLTIRHAIMHYRVRLKVFDAVLTGNAQAKISDVKRAWVAVSQLSQLPFSSPQRKVAASILSQPHPVATLLDEPGDH